MIKTHVRDDFSQVDSWGNKFLISDTKIISNFFEKFSRNLEGRKNAFGTETVFFENEKLKWSNKLQNGTGFLTLKLFMKVWTLIFVV